MDHVIVTAPEDAGEAERLAAAIGASGLAGRIQYLLIEDERDLGASLEQDRDGTSTYVLLLSRALSQRIASLDELDRLLGAVLFGHRRILAACLADERAPAPDLLRLARRHDAITEESNLEGAARRVIGRLARIQVHSPSAGTARGAAPDSRRVRLWLVGIIVVLLGLLVAVSVGNLRRG